MLLAPEAVASFEPLQLHSLQVSKHEMQKHEMRGEGGTATGGAHRSGAGEGGDARDGRGGGSAASHKGDSHEGGGSQDSSDSSGGSRHRVSNETVALDLDSNGKVRRDETPSDAAGQEQCVAFMCGFHVWLSHELMISLYRCSFPRARCPAGEQA